MDNGSTSCSNVLLSVRNNLFRPVFMKPNTLPLPLEREGERERGGEERGGREVQRNRRRKGKTKLYM